MQREHCTKTVIANTAHRLVEGKPNKARKSTVKEIFRRRLFDSPFYHNELLNLMHSTLPVSRNISLVGSKLYCQQFC